MASEKKEIQTSVYLYNVLGELLYQDENITNNILYFDISDFFKGIYFVKVIKGNDMFVAKVIYQ